MQATWILVADAARARLFSPAADGGPLALLEEFDHPDGRRSGREPERDRLPRTTESMGDARHAIEPRTSEDDKVAERFALELGDVLERGRVDHRYERLVLAAPPRFLGTLQQALGKHVRECVVARIDKDLTRLPVAEIEARVGTLAADHAPPRQS